MPYKVWEAKLREQVRYWYSVLEEEGNTEEVSRNSSVDVFKLWVISGAITQIWVVKCGSLLWLKTIEKIRMDVMCTGSSSKKILQHVIIIILFITFDHLFAMLARYRGQSQSNARIELQYCFFLFCFVFFSFFFFPWRMSKRGAIFKSNLSLIQTWKHKMIHVVSSRYAPLYLCAKFHLILPIKWAWYDKKGITFWLPLVVHATCSEVVTLPTKGYQ